MKICLVSKYPPIEGQVSTINYWLARGLAKKGHTVIVITNAYESHLTECSFTQVDDKEFYEPRFAENGGKVFVLNTKSYDKDQIFIPRNNPSVTKITNLILIAAKKFNIEVILTHYLEPYAIAGYMASVFLKIPHVITHSGSDIGRLLKNPHLQQTYLEIIKRAHYFVPKNKIATQIPHNRHQNEDTMPFSPDGDFFNCTVLKMDINEFMVTASTYIKNELKWHTNHFDKNKITIGVYGKLLKEKRIFELISALGQMNSKKYPFNLVIMSRWIDGEENLRNHIENNNIADSTWLLPFIPTWKIPSFIKLCDAICYLEHDWPMPNHVTIVPKEVIACETILVTSEEVYNNRWHQKYLKDGANCIVIKDPGNVNEIIEKLTFFFENGDFKNAAAEQYQQNSLLFAKGYKEFVNSWEKLLLDTLSP